MPFSEWNVHEPYLSDFDLDLIHRQYGTECFSRLK